MLFPKNIFIIIIAAFFTSIFISCNDNEIKLLKVTETVSTKKLCYLKTADHGHGILYNMTYDAKNLLTKIEGFPDFDELIYQNGLPIKATSSFDKTYHIEYSYDANGTLSLINFVGQDSKGKPFEFKSKVYANSKKQIERIDLSLPVFDQIIVTKIEYDANNNLKKVFLVENGVSKVLLENLAFDDKKSPYLNTPIGNVMLYFTIFSATIGSENTTYFSNKNNATSTKIYTDSGEIVYAYAIEYNNEDYATKIKISKKVKGKEEKYEENFTYTSM